jgi:hypothetical protein
LWLFIHSFNNPGFIKNNKRQKPRDKGFITGEINKNMANRKDNIQPEKE